ncbi:MAG: hypothetical protein Q4C95_09325 [Planctomycetia bacterium]|nr:hypothetical protein [Planctomycetia bacterium]
MENRYIEMNERVALPYSIRSQKRLGSLDLLNAVLSFWHFFGNTALFSIFATKLEFLCCGDKKEMSK